jgi:hypothetical protein
MAMFDDNWLQAIDSCSTSSNRSEGKQLPLLNTEPPRRVYREVTDGFRDPDDPIMEVPEIW